jgi:hypothetical protein
LVQQPCARCARRGASDGCESTRALARRNMPDAPETCLPGRRDAHLRPPRALAAQPAVRAHSPRRAPRRRAKSNARVGTGAGCIFRSGVCEFGQFRAAAQRALTRW